MANKKYVPEMNIKIEEHFIKEDPDCNEVIPCFVPESESESHDSDDDIFEELMDNVKLNLSYGKVFTTEDLYCQYKAMLSDSLEGLNYPNKLSLKFFEKKLKSKFKNDLQIFSCTTQDKPNIVVLSSLNIQNELNTLANFRRIFKEIDGLSSTFLEPSQITSGTVLFYAARLLRTMMKDISKNINFYDEFLNLESVSKNAVETHIPSDLYNFFYWLLTRERLLLMKNDSSNEFRNTTDDLHDSILDLVQTAIKLLSKHQTDSSENSDSEGGSDLCQVFVTHNDARQAMLMRSTQLSVEEVTERVRERLCLPASAALQLTVLDPLQAMHAPLALPLVRSGAEIRVEVLPEEGRKGNEDEEDEVPDMEAMEEESTSPVLSASDEDINMIRNYFNSSSPSCVEFREVIEDSPPKKRRRLKKNLPHPYTVPVDAIPAYVKRAVESGEPFAKVHVSAITTALYEDVIRYNYYPSPAQYDEVVQGLFAALPGLRERTDPFPTRAHALWKTRLQYKFRNCRRRRDGSPALPTPRVRHWRSLCSLLAEGETLYSARETHASQDLAPPPPLPPSPPPPPPQLTLNRLKDEDSNSCPSSDDEPSDHVTVHVSLGTSERSLTVPREGLTLPGLLLGAGWSLESGRTLAGAAVLDEKMRVYRPLLPGAVAGLRDGARIRLVTKRGRSEEDVDEDVESDKTAGGGLTAGLVVEGNAGGSVRVDAATDGGVLSADGDPLAVSSEQQQGAPSTAPPLLPWPPQYRLPPDAVPSRVRLLLEQRRPLPQSAVSAVARAVYCDVTRYVFYPTPRQYREVVAALFAELPLLAAATDDCHQQAFEVWRQRLRYKFSNTRRRLDRAACSKWSRREAGVE